MKIALVEDDILLNDTLIDILSLEGYVVTPFFTFHEAESGLYESYYDAIILDVNLPDGDGFTLAKRLRQNNILTPILFLTAQSDVQSVQQGFKAGGDDYLKKPFEPLELHARLTNLLRRSFATPRSQTLSFNSYSYDITAEKVYDSNGFTIELHTKELAVLKLLLKRRGHVVSYEEFFSTVWDYSQEPSMDTLRTHIKNLRKSLPSIVIESVRSVGYTLV